MNIKYAFNSIKRNKFQSILIVLLISMALISFYIVLFLSNSLKDQYNYVENYFNGGNVYSIATNWRYYKPKIDKIDKSIYEKIYKSIDAMDNVDLINYERIAVNFDSSNPDLKGLEQDKIMESDSIYIQGMGISEAAINHYDLEVLEGKMFNKEENEDGIINAVVGYHFKDMFNIGDILVTDVGKKFKITGFLKKDMYIPTSIGESDNASYEKYDLGKAIVCDLNNFLGEDFSYYLSISGAYIHMAKDISEGEKLQIKQKIKNEFNKYNIEVNVIDQSKGIFLALSEIKKQIMLFNISSITILTFISFSIIITILNSLENRKKEFGVYILSGANITDISKIVFFEICILNLISFSILCIVVIGIKIASIKFLIYIFILTLMYCIFTFLIPLRKIKNISIKDLIKGEE